MHSKCAAVLILSLIVSIYPCLSGCDRSAADQPENSAAPTNSSVKEIANSDSETSTESADDELTPAQMEEMRRLESLGYIGGVEDAPEESDVTIYDEEACWNGVNFVLSSHGREAYLMDMEGETLHTWRYEQENTQDHEKIPALIFRHWYFRKALPLPNGDVIAVLGFPHGKAVPKNYPNVGMARLDKDSNPLWTYAGKAHHDFDVRADGTIVTLTHEARVNPRIREEKPVLEDFVTVLDANGNELETMSVYECMVNGGCEDLIAKVKERTERDGDILHCNSLQILDGAHADMTPAFKADDALISIRELHAVIVLDLDERKVTWSHSGEFRMQHDAKILDNGNLMLFDNLGCRKASAVREIDPSSGEEVWIYPGSPEYAFSSHEVGACYRLPNGNTLIVESVKGKAFEVLPDGERVWEYVNPHRTGANDQRIAQLMDLMRLGPEYSLDWLKN